MNLEKYIQNNQGKQIIYENLKSNKYNIKQMGFQKDSSMLGNLTPYSSLSNNTYNKYGDFN